MRKVRLKNKLTFLVAAVALSACHGKSNTARSGTGADPGVPVDPLPPPIEQNVSTHSNAYFSRYPYRPTIRRARRSARRDQLWSLAQAGVQDIRNVCARGQGGQVLQSAPVTHYYIPPGASVGSYKCKSGTGYFNQPELRGLCLHPCRTLAADPRHYRPGEILFFPSLVGMKCGSGRNEMIHDGFMVVADNGDSEAINIPGRFGVFWGQCNKDQNGFCLDEGAIAIDFALTFSNYCRAWRPQDPLHHSDLKLLMYYQVRSEAIRRGDRRAADFDLDSFIGLGVRNDGLIFRRSSQ